MLGGGWQWGSIKLGNSIPALDSNCCLPNYPTIWPILHFPIPFLINPLCVGTFQISARRAFQHLVITGKRMGADYAKYCDGRRSHCTIVITIFYCAPMVITWATMITDRLHPEPGLHLIVSIMQLGSDRKSSTQKLNPQLKVKAITSPWSRAIIWTGCNLEIKWKHTNSLFTNLPHIEARKS